jgi:predicted transcriptional regulator
MSKEYKQYVEDYGLTEIRIEILKALHVLPMNEKLLYMMLKSEFEKTDIYENADTLIECGLVVKEDDSVLGINFLYITDKGRLIVAEILKEEKCSEKKYRTSDQFCEKLKELERYAK